MCSFINRKSIFHFNSVSLCNDVVTRCFVKADNCKKMFPLIIIMRRNELKASENNLQKTSKLVDMVLLDRVN